MSNTINMFAMHVRAFAQLPDHRIAFRCTQRTVILGHAQQALQYLCASAAQTQLSAGPACPF